MTRRLAARRRIGGAVLLAGTIGLLAAPAAAWGYVGPGAGVAFVTTSLALVATLLLVLAGLLTWPLRWLWRRLRRRRPPRAPRLSRAVVVGLDGLDPDVVGRLIDAGKLPAMAGLAERGTFRPLATTCPPLSPVAWSTFATGVQPGKHGIFDFVTRDPATYQPALSSSDLRPPARALRLGPWRLPIGRPRMRLLRRGTPFWRLLADHGVPCAVLRVPITFPPEPFDGLLLSAMCTPDLEGTQGTYTVFATDVEDGRTHGGRRVRVQLQGGRVAGALVGPPNPIRRDGRTLRLPFTLRLAADGRGARLAIGGRRVELEVGRPSAWIPVEFPLGLGRALPGICRFHLLEATAERLRLYVTPIQIDPARPAMPISHPPVLAPFLARLLGRFATLGLAEDTGALVDGVLDDDEFLAQVDAIQTEREAMFLEVLRRTPRGVTVCVFDATDRVQHMFLRAPGDGSEAARRAAAAIEAAYVRADALVGRALAAVGDDPRALVLVVSDHGFKPFRRGVSLNAWLRARGYLALEGDRDTSDEWLGGVDWSRTRAYALGLGGLYLNVRGREARGVVDPADAPALADELAAGLAGLVDPAEGAVAIRRAWAAHRLYRGPYVERAPDVVVGYEAGWRASWESARGVVGREVFADNPRAWRGDHCIDPERVPGVLLASRPLGRAGEAPTLADVAPTLLDLFGVPPPRHLDGRALELA